jgi:hypothetical protein
MAVPKNDVKLGDMILADGGFTCIGDSEVLEVFQDKDNLELYVKCAVGRHFLKGAEDDHGMLIGFSKYEDPNEPVLSTRQKF